MESLGKSEYMPDVSMYIHDVTPKTEEMPGTSLLEGVSDSTKARFPYLTESIERRGSPLSDSVIDNYAPLDSSKSQSSFTESSSIRESLENITEDYVPNQLKTVVVALKVDSIAQRQFEKINEGKVKEVWREVGVASEYVYYTAKEDTENVQTLKKIPVIGKVVEAVKHSPLQELKEESQFGLRIEAKREEKQLEKSVNLATQMEESDVQIEGKYTLRVLAANRGDLEGVIGNKNVAFLDRMQIGAGVVNGMAELHEADYVHGDSKPENILVYGQKDSVNVQASEVKIADFGKAQPIKEGEKLHYYGNPRFAPPEQQLSKKGEVYSTCLVLIRNLEEEFLDKEGTPLITNYTLDKRGVAGSERRGVEKFVVENSKCTQSEIESVAGKVSFGMRGATKTATEWFGLPQKTSYDEAEGQLHNYIDVLTAKLEEEHKEHKDAIQDLNRLLKTMARTNPDEIPEHRGSLGRSGHPKIPGRPTMAQVNTEYVRIMTAIQSKTPQNNV